MLHRLLHATGPQQPKPMHPLQIMAMLHNQYRRLARLDDPAIRDVDAAMAALGGRVKQYPARKALEQSRALGTTGIRDAFDALFQADLDLKGARAIPAEVVVEMLVAQLATLSARRATPGEQVGRSPIDEHPVGGRPVEAPVALLGGLVRALHQARDPAGRGVLVDAPLAPGLVDALLGGTQQVGRVLAAGVRGLDGDLDPRLQLRADGQVALTTRLVLDGSASSGS